ncbi:MAG: AMP-binding protein [Verrucomicrobia bacterium]|nr:AMP-binding protein [Verrucomicrobiota bacterium]
MDPQLLNDPGWWLDERPLAPDGFPGGLPDLPELAGKVLFATSGSSGRPKWIALTKEALLVSAAAVNAYLEVNADSVWGLALPWHHVGGFGVLARAHEAACRCATFGLRWNPEDFRKFLIENGVTHCSLVPTQVHDLVSAGIAAPQDLRAVVVGGGRLTENAGRAARSLGWPVLASYGMTEAGSQIATQGMDSLGSLYQPDPIPVLPHWRVRTTDEGRLEIAGSALFAGMLEEGGGAWRYHARTEEWHATNDRVLVSADGLTPLGRVDAVVKVLGELVDPERVGEELLERGAGQLLAGSCAVVAIPDARAGHRLVPVFDESVSRGLATEVLDAYHASAPGFRRLDRPVWVENLPRSPLGKLLRRDLTDQIARTATPQGTGS